MNLAFPDKKIYISEGTLYEWDFNKLMPHTEQTIWSGRNAIKFDKITDHAFSCGKACGYGYSEADGDADDKLSIHRTISGCDQS